MTYGLLILTEKKMIIFLVKIGFRYVENVTEKLPDTVAGFERPIFSFTKWPFCSCATYSCSFAIVNDWAIVSLPF